jgi:hypothetical protein
VRGGGIGRNKRDNSPRRIVCPRVRLHSMQLDLLETNYKIKTNPRQHETMDNNENCEGSPNGKRMYRVEGEGVVQSGNPRECT